MTDRNLIGSTELRDRLATYSQTPRARVHLLLDTLAIAVADELAQGHRVRIPGIGILDVRETPARSGTGPDGTPYSAPARRRVRLRPDRALTRAVQVEFKDAPPQATPANSTSSGAD